MKRGEQQKMERLEIPNQEKIRTLGEKETHKYLEILNEDTIKHAEIKWKIKKEYQENNSKPNKRAEISSKV